MIQYVGIALQDFNILHMIELGVVARIVSAPLIDVVGHNLLGSKFGRSDTEDARATAAIQHPLARELHIQQQADDHLGSLMRACAESLTGLNGYRDGSLWKLGRRLTCIIDDNAVVDVDRIEAIVLPSLIPVLKVIGHGDAGQRKVNKLSIELLLVELLLPDITFDTIVGIFERLKARLTRTVGHKITRRLQKRRLRNDMKRCCKIFHKPMIKLFCKIIKIRENSTII